MIQEDSTVHASAESHSPPKVKDQIVELYEDLGHEIAVEVETHDSSQSDVLVKKHVTGIAISFFILIGLGLLAAIAGIALYTHL
jgi:hypothetical protein